MINADGYCWCGQQWDGEKMCFPKLTAASDKESQIANDE